MQRTPSSHGKSAPAPLVSWSYIGRLPLLPNPRIIQEMLVIARLEVAPPQGVPKKRIFQNTLSPD
eukprot:scaffold2946_cov294-Pinguiococcus_pyrenoidosus.AAC.8